MPCNSILCGLSAAVLSVSMRSIAAYAIQAELSNPLPSYTASAIESSPVLCRSVRYGLSFPLRSGTLRCFTASALLSSTLPCIPLRPVLSNPVLDAPFLYGRSDA